jgi:hypothetical protein
MSILKLKWMLVFFLLIIPFSLASLNTDFIELEVNYVDDTWSYYHGNVTSDIVLSTEDNETILMWNVTNLNNSLIYATDKEASVSWFDLQALGSNGTGVSCCNGDFSELDTLLELTGLDTSLNSTFTVGGAAKQSQSWRIQDEYISNLYTINLSSTSNFDMSILWDTSDDVGDGEYDSTDKEDIIFAVPLLEDGTCTYGSCDFEIKIPYTLANYDPTDSTTLYLYLEIN